MSVIEYGSNVIVYDGEAGAFTVATVQERRMSSERQHKGRRIFHRALVSFSGAPRDGKFRILEEMCKYRPSTP